MGDFYIKMWGALFFIVQRKQQFKRHFLSAINENFVHRGPKQKLTKESHLRIQCRDSDFEQKTVMEKYGTKRQK